jgi:hypothetical protein
MSFGSSDGNRFPGMLASREDRDATQAVLETAFADERLTQDEFEARTGRCLSARTLADLAELTRDLPAAPGSGLGPMAPGPRRRPARRPPRWVWFVVSGAAAVVIAAVFGLVALTSSSTTSLSQGAAPAPASTGSQPAAAASSGPARCPVGTSATAVAIANSLAADPLYVDPASSHVSAGQARRIRARIASVDPGRIRVAAVTKAALRRGGGARALANSIGSCPATSAGTVLVATPSTAWLVTSYADYKDAAQAVQSALNTHGTLGAGLLDAVGRIATIDPGH